MIMMLMKVVAKKKMRGNLYRQTSGKQLRGAKAIKQKTEKQQNQGLKHRYTYLRANCSSFFNVTGAVSQRTEVAYLKVKFNFLYLSMSSKNL